MAFPGEVCAATVTYGDRAQLCIQVLDRLLDEGVHTIVVVLNGTTPESAAQIVTYAGQYPGRFKLVDATANTGSAGGFAQAIEAAVGTECEWIWILDDDNLPERGALAPLVSLGATLPVTDVLFSLREGDKYQAAAAKGSDLYPRPGSFLYFDIFDSGRRKIKHQGIGNPVIPYGPYGGMFCRSELLDGFGYPNVEMFLYEDDTEYTMRLAAAGSRLLLCPLSRITDIDGKWSEGGATRGPARFLLSPDLLRLEYAVRNRVAVDCVRMRASARSVRVRISYLINRSIYKAAIRYYGWKLHAEHSRDLFLSSVIEGESSARREAVARDFSTHHRGGSQGAVCL